MSQSINIESSPEKRPAGGFTALRRVSRQALLKAGLSVALVGGGAATFYDAVTVSPQEQRAKDQEKAAQEAAVVAEGRAEMKQLAIEGKLAERTVPDNTGAFYAVDSVNDLTRMTSEQVDAAEAFVERQAPGGIVQPNTEYSVPLVAPDPNALSAAEMR